MIEVEDNRLAFKAGRYATVRDAWQHGLDESHWSHGITINLGNDMSVSDAEVQRRVSYIRVNLLKAMFGNNWRRKASADFIAFRGGSKELLNQHWHVLMSVRGTHDWSNEKIAKQISQIENRRPRERWEKVAHVACNWKNDNRFHSYCAREIQPQENSGGRLSQDSFLLL